MNATKACALWSCAAALLAGCSSTPLNTPATAPAPVAQQSPTPAAEAAPQPAAASTVATVALPEYLDPKSPISANRSVYFDFDEFSIKPEYNPLIERHGEYLSSHAPLAIKIEGNADERGSAEYNLALGHKRAQAVLNALKIYGVKETQIGHQLGQGAAQGPRSRRGRLGAEPARRFDLPEPVG